MPEKLTELFDIDWRETSFVPAGDNPPAKIVMWKNDPGLTDEEIEEVLQEAETERRAEMPTAKLTKQSDAEAAATALAKKLIEDEPGRFAKIVDPSAQLVAARAVIWAENPDLREAREMLPPDPVELRYEAPASLEKGAPALTKRDAAVRELRKIYPHESEASLRVRALRENPSIYEEYRRLSGS